MTSRARRGVGPLLVAASVLGTVMVAAEPASAADYDLDPDAWNGLGYLMVTAEEAKVALEPVEVLDLGRLRPGDVLVWLYPERRMPVEPILSFVRDGGYLVLADDHGHGDELLNAVGIRRRDEPREHPRWYQSQEGLPVWQPSRDHFLFFNVEDITGNHARSLEGSGDPILTWGPPASAVVLERRLGHGAILAIADPSIFLNEMLRRFYGNKQFAANAMRLYCDRDVCPVRLVLPDATIAGSYRAGLGRLGRLPALFDDAAELINTQLGVLTDALRGTPWTQALVGLLLLMAFVSLGATLRARASRRGPPPLQMGIAGTSPGFVDVAGLARAHREADFAEPARVLLAEAHRLEQAPALLTLQPRTVGPGGVAAAEPPERGRAERAAQEALLRIQAEADSLRGPEPAVVSAERFQRLLADIHTLGRFVDGDGAGR